MKAFADDKINVTGKLKFVLGMVENIVFSFSHDIFKASYLGSLKSRCEGKG